MRLFLIVLFSLLSSCIIAQESLTTYEKVYAFPDKLFGALHKKSNQFEQGVLTSTQKYLKRMQRSEEKMKRKLMKKDSVKAEELFGDVEDRYTAMRSVIENPNSKLPKVYNSRLDSIKTAVSFIDINKYTGQVDAIQKNLPVLQKDFTGAQLSMNKIDFSKKNCKRDAMFYNSN